VTPNASRPSAGEAYLLGVSMVDAEIEDPRTSSTGNGEAEDPRDRGGAEAQRLASQRSEAFPEAMAIHLVSEAAVG
jgi:hypothetical protein